METSLGEIRYLNPPSLEGPPGYSHVVDVSVSRLIFIAGQAGVDAGGTVVGGRDLEAQADQAFRNLSVALESVGCNAANLVKLTVFIRDMNNLPDYRRARDRFFNTVNPPVAPAITLVEVSRLYSESLLIEIEAVAAAPSAKRRFFALFPTWRRRLRDRRKLALMCDQSLKDLGVTRSDVANEIRKPFWRA